MAVEDMVMILDDALPGLSSVYGVEVILEMKRIKGDILLSD